MIKLENQGALSYANIAIVLPVAVTRNSALKTGMNDYHSI
jgi:hypothetical protein